MLVSLASAGFGASTGFMASRRGQWRELVSRAESLSAAAVELSALSASELPALAAFLQTDPWLPFPYVSVHGPAKEWTQTPRELAQVLADTLTDRVAGVVMHPETLGEPAAFGSLGSRLLLENMDSQKTDARTVDELEPYFDALPSAGFCFDIAHAYINDPSMMLAHDLIDAFGHRLREVHLSSILPDGTHVPLRGEDVPLFEPVLRRCRDVPWIFEAQF